MTFTDAAAEIGAAIGRDVEYRDVSGPEAREQLVLDRSSSDEPGHDRQKRCQDD